MPVSLKRYVLGVVAIGAIALVAATILFPPSPEIAIPIGAGWPAGLGVALGIGYWIVLTLVSSALPVELPRGTKQAVAIAPIMGSMFLGGRGIIK